VSGNIPIGVKRVNAAKCIWLVMINESYWLTCKYSWILGQSALSFMIESIIDRSIFKMWSPKLRKAMSISTHHDDLWSFAQIVISVPNQRKGHTSDRTHNQQTNAYKSTRGSRLTSLTISYTHNVVYKSTKGSRLTFLTMSYMRNTVYKSVRGSRLTSLNIYLMLFTHTAYTKSKGLLIDVT
jgi:hypothetical protein